MTGRTGLQRLSNAATAVTIAGVLLSSAVYPASTRVFASPWSLVYSATLAGAAVVLMLRAADKADRLVLPNRTWTILALAAAAVVLASAATSPFAKSSLLWSAPLLAAVAWFFCVVDWLRRGAEVTRRSLADRVLTATLLVVIAAGALQWIADAWGASRAHIIAARNPYPLGHSNYTAGIAVLALPVFAAVAWRNRGAPRGLGIIGLLGTLFMLVTSASRAGAIGLLGTGLAAVVLSPLSRAAKWKWTVVSLAVVVGFACLHPRTRAMLFHRDSDAVPNSSDVQRHAMLEVGRRMGTDRPLLGWGPGTTPLVFPRYRADVDGGAEDVLQLHSLPVQLWAELGALGCLVALGIATLALRSGHREPAVVAALVGYGLFSIFDWQLDVPLFGFVIATLLAQVAQGEARAPAPATWSRWLGVLAAGGLAVIALLGTRYQPAELNVRALSDAVGRAKPVQAVGLLRESLASNPHQEIAHFNLGWLLVVDDPPEAARHFRAAAQLVPDKGGVYFGLGLSQLNAGQKPEAVRLFALEALNDPTFLLSPWWNAPPLDALRPLVGEELRHQLARARTALVPGSPVARRAAYVDALIRWLDGALPALAVAELALTAEQKTYFRSNPDRQELTRLPAIVRRNERVGYPVLMRNLDLPPPTDLWVARESSVRDSKFGFLFPEKGWLPSRVLIALLERPDR